MPRYTAAVRRWQSARRDHRNATNPVRILHIEDNPGDCRLLVDTLRSDLHLPNTVTQCGDGEEALRILERVSRDTFDVILLDINMPLMNGHELLAALGVERAKRLPIVVHTSAARGPECNRILDAGAQACFTKGSDLESTIAIYREIFSPWLVAARQADPSIS